MINIAWQHLHPRRHLPACRKQCSSGCPTFEFEAALNAPVLPSEIASAKAEEKRLKALAAGQFNYPEGARDEAGQPAD